MDKFRKQPTRILEPNFEWQNCHRVLYPHLGIGAHDTDEAIAERFLEFSFDNFPALLPDVIKMDAHFHPQYWTRRISLLGGASVVFPCRVLRVEDRGELSSILGLEITKYTNSTRHLNQDFEVTANNRSQIHKLYRRDFALGEYSIDS